MPGSAAEVGVDHRRVGHHRVRVAVGDDAPGVHADEPRHHLDEHVNDVLDPDDGDLRTPQLADRLDQLARLGVRQAGADLVQQQHDRVGRERPRQLEPLAVEQAERLRAAVGGVEHAADLERVDATARRRPRACARRRRSPPTNTFSKTVMPPNGRGTWCARAIPSRQRRADPPE